MCLNTTKSQLKKYDNKLWVCPQCKAEENTQKDSLAELGNSTKTSHMKS